MGLKLAKTTAEGFTVEYWCINPMVSVDLAARRVHARLMAYKDKAARDASMQPVQFEDHSDEFTEVRSIKLEGQDFETAMASGDFRDAMYAQVKAQDFFVGSEDVLET
jgi:hypothetical protein